MYTLLIICDYIIPTNVGNHANSDTLGANIYKQVLNAKGLNEIILKKIKNDGLIFLLIN